jgi:hypothetical protein
MDSKHNVVWSMAEIRYLTFKIEAKDKSFESESNKILDKEQENFKLSWLDEKDSGDLKDTFPRVAFHYHA